MTKLYEAGEHLLICSGYSDPAEHQHMAAHVLISMGEDLDAIFPDRQVRCRGILIPSGVSHRIQTHGEQVLVFLWDSTTYVSAQITQIQTVPGFVCDGIVSRYRAYEAQGDYADFLTFTLQQLCLRDTGSCVKDARIREAMDFIDTHISEQLTCRGIAQAVYLSPSRLSHLFREQLGMTIPAYIIYRRLMFVYAEVIRGRSITQSAIAAGFSSSGHFADVSRRVFGLSATQITRDLDFTKIP